MKGIANDFSVDMNGAINSVLNFSINFVEVDTMMGVGDKPTTVETTQVGRFNILF